MKLSDYVAAYCRERAIDSHYRVLLTIDARQLTKFAGGSLETESLAGELVSRFLDWSEPNCADTTLANKRRRIKTIWLAAHEEGLAPPIGKIRKVRVRRKIPRGLTLADMSTLLAAADRQQGCFRLTETPRKMFFRALFLAYFDTALRIGDLLSIERPWIWPGGYLSIVQHKTDRTHRVKLRPQTIEAIDKLMGDRKTGLVWPLWCTRRNFFKAIRVVMNDAGLGEATSRWIRRSSASYVEKSTPGMGWRHLGHAKPGLAEESYLDPSILAHEPTQPPEIA